MKKLRLARHSEFKGLMPIYELLELPRPVRKFVGVKLSRYMEDGMERFEYIDKPEGDVVNYRSEYVKAVKQGDLVPLDEETAKLCKVKFKQV